MARRWERGVDRWSPGKSPLSRLLACIVSSTRRCDVSIILFSSLFPFNLAASIFFVHGFLSWPRPRFPLKNFVKPLLHPRAYWSPLLVLSAKQFCNCFNEMGKWPCDLMLLKKKKIRHILNPRMLHWLYPLSGIFFPQMTSWPHPPLLLCLCSQGDLSWLLCVPLTPQLCATFHFL